jgi:hypothetical protein
MAGSRRRLSSGDKNKSSAKGISFLIAGQTEKILLKKYEDRIWG